ncbi:ribonuclease P protein component [Hydrotalea sandarakina]|jgi:ribonuclease P protein component|uniref:Ribonuclease P protein component n=1 Tax=Hydrotalea sandarakina TaxID=1004304 RepID=A0A2W7RVE2_9BACT|nr:ribonuclease P protein component [Hydrotalea sandarakina]PZX62806.1 ribonuclease P protein component [Hydrotalea sandarakina]
MTNGLYAYSKPEKLKSRKQIEALFAGGQQLYAYPIKIFYNLTNNIAEQTHLLQAGVAVSSRYFKKAVHRNYIKRLLREAYRLNKVELKTAVYQKQVKLNLFIIYVGKEMPEKDKLPHVVKKLLLQLNRKVDEMDKEHT